MTTGETIAVTGHRPDKLGGYGDTATRDAIIEALHAALVDLQPAKAISGMALGVDQYFAQVCVELEIPFVAAIPFEGQESRWPKLAQRRYATLIAHAAEVITVCDGGYKAWKMQTRNQWMVDHCDRLIAVWNGGAGGTGNCVRYAERMGCRIHVIEPQDPKWSPA